MQGRPTGTGIGEGKTADLKHAGKGSTICRGTARVRASPLNSDGRGGGDPPAVPSKDRFNTGTLSFDSVDLFDEPQVL